MKIRCDEEDAPALLALRELVVAIGRAQGELFRDLRSPNVAKAAAAYAKLSRLLEERQGDDP